MSENAIFNQTFLLTLVHPFMLKCDFGILTLYFLHLLFVQQVVLSFTIQSGHPAFNKIYYFQKWFLATEMIAVGRY